jgi:hypothetical protein
MGRRRISIRLASEIRRTTTYGLKFFEVPGVILPRVDSRVLFASDLDGQGCHTRVEVSLLGRFESRMLDHILGKSSKDQTTTHVPYPLLHVVHNPPPLNLGRVRHLAL